MNLNLTASRASQYRQQGSMLLSVLFIMVVLAALMAAMVTVSNQSSQQLVYEVQALKARLVAESVLEKEIFAQLSAINERLTESSFDGCKGRTKSSLYGSVELKQINIIATGECDSGQLTVIRNIEVEVLSNEN